MISAELRPELCRYQPKRAADEWRPSRPVEVKHAFVLWQWGQVNGSAYGLEDDEGEAAEIDANQLGPDYQRLIVKSGKDAMPSYDYSRLIDVTKSVPVL